MKLVACLVLFLLCAACGDNARLPVEAGLGPTPQLPPPDEETLPTVALAPANRWSAEESPQVVAGLRVTRFASGLRHPRWLLALPNGDVLVAEATGPDRSTQRGMSAWVTRQVMARAGAGEPSANRVTLLRDADSDGVAEIQRVLLEGLHAPFGLALVADRLYVAATDAVYAVPYTLGARTVTTAPVKVFDLPAGPHNYHWTRSLLASADGQRLYVAVGSNSNIAERGLGEEQDRAAILEHDFASGRTRRYATGLRNPVGLAWQPDTGALWVTVNERDQLGGDLVPDYLTSVREGAFYGWPYSYFGAHVDTRVQPPRPDLVATAVTPDYALGSHTASLGLAFTTTAALGERFASGAFIAQHGSWNRRPRSGYKVIFVPFANGQPAGLPIDVLTGFVSPSGEARGRPTGVAIDTHGALLVADDVGNTVWRISAAAQ